MAIAAVHIQNIGKYSIFSTLTQCSCGLPESGDLTGMIIFEKKKKTESDKPYAVKLIS